MPDEAQGGSFVGANVLELMRSFNAELRLRKAMFVVLASVRLLRGLKFPTKTLRRDTIPKPAGQVPVASTAEEEELGRASIATLGSTDPTANAQTDVK